MTNGFFSKLCSNCGKKNCVWEMTKIRILRTVWTHNKRIWAMNMRSKCGVRNFCHFLSAVERKWAQMSTIMSAIWVHMSLILMSNIYLKTYDFQKFLIKNKININLKTRQKFYISVKVNIVNQKFKKLKSLGFHKFLKNEK